MKYIKYIMKKLNIFKFLDSKSNLTYMKKA